MPYDSSVSQAHEVLGQFAPKLQNSSSSRSGFFTRISLATFSGIRMSHGSVMYSKLNNLLNITPGVMNNGVLVDIKDFERYSIDIGQFTKLGEPVFLKNNGKQEMVILGVEEYAKLIKKRMD